MITESDIEDALDFLQETADAIANAKAELERADILCKRVRKRLFLSTPDGTVALREATAEVNRESEEADERYCTAIATYESLKAKRELRCIQIEVWRTQSASQRARI